jgi:hypothetical protein
MVALIYLMALCVAVGAAGTSNAQGAVAEVFEARRILQEASRIAAAISSDKWKAVTILGIAQAQANAGDVRGAVQTAAALSGGDVKKASALDYIAVAQAEGGDMGGARQTAANIKDNSLKIGALHEIVRVQAKSGDVKGALQTAAIIPVSAWRDYAVRAVARIQAEAGDVNGALHTAALRKGSSRAVIVNDVAVTQARAGDFTGALRTAATIQENSSREAAHERLSSQALRAASALQADDAKNVAFLLNRGSPGQSGGHEWSPSDRRLHQWGLAQ